MKILVITPYLPMPDRGSGELRLFALLKILALSHQVSIYTWSWGQEVSAADKDRYRDNFAKEGIVQETQGLRSVLQRNSYDAIIFEWYYWVPWYIDDVKTWQPNAKIIIDTVDIEFRRLELQAKATGEYTGEYLRETKRQELTAYEKADMLIAVSAEEKALLADELPGKDVGVVPNIHQFPETLSPLTREPNVLFIGNFRFDPNLDAVRYFCAEIWDEIRAKVTAAKFRIVGNALPVDDLPLFRSNGIEAIGYVPETATYLSQSRVSVAPLRFGAGVKGKVGEAVAAGVPVVTTTIGFQGMPLIPGREIVVADSPAEFARSVVTLLTDHDLCERQRRAAWHRLRAEFGFAAVRTRVDDIMDRVPHLESRSLGVSRRWRRRAKYFFDQHLLWRFESFKSH